ncbi:hypothetical protein [Brucella thiophenivorans]|uniref:Uncharacterized protein n=1 Tax=Brucella thiophenivorans TaxID=571255 RepID=A0A256FTW1_9HYPH|nr:hypothetical protein [Brucella thiophenivorans]OYR18263.1 hypothetical protein CEV31_4275 [Brucella thiophenivorans]
MLDVITRSRYVTLAAYGTCICGFMLYMGEPPAPPEHEKQEQATPTAPPQDIGTADYQSPHGTYEKETSAPVSTLPPSSVAEPVEPVEHVKPAPPPKPKILDLSNDDDAPTINFKKSSEPKYDFQN